MNVKDSEIKALLSKYKKFTVYGLSPDPTKPSHSVPMYMKSQGYDIVGTYPKGDQVNGVSIYQNLKNVPPEYRKFIDVFRSSDAIPRLVDEILDLGGVEVLWLQLGITHAEAEKRAEAAGIRVVSNRCILVEHKRNF